MGAGPLQMIGVSDQLKRGRYRLERVLLQMIGRPDQLGQGFWEMGEVPEPLIKRVNLIALRLRKVNYLAEKD